MVKHTATDDRVTVSIVIPVFNEATNLEELLAPVAHDAP